jgi:hypothetical protein
MKIPPVGADLFHADRRTDGHNEAESLLAILRKRLKITAITPDAG